MTVAQILTKDTAWLDGRRRGLGGSDANIIASGDPDAILHLWQEKRGEVEPEDLSHVLPVQFGVYCEPFNLYWFELMTGRKVSDAGESRVHPSYPFMACTLDGLTTSEDGTAAVFEAKMVNAFSKIDDVVQRYMPQLHHCMSVVGIDRAILSVFIGTLKYEIVETRCDDWFLSQLIDREKAFWACVESGEPPADMPVVEPPKPPAEWRTVDMQDSNSWASSAADWLENKDAAKRFDKAVKDIKALVEPDVGLASGHSVQAKRAKNGSIRITEMKK